MKKWLLMMAMIMCCLVGCGKQETLPEKNRRLKNLIQITWQNIRLRRRRISSTLSGKQKSRRKQKTITDRRSILPRYLRLNLRTPIMGMRWDSEIPTIITVRIMRMGTAKVFM